MSEPFRYYLRVRYGECDAQKVVFNARYGEYIDLAITEFLRALGYEEEMITAELDFQLVRQTTQWRAPARYDNVLEGAVTTLSVGTTSFTLRCQFRIAGEENVICESETIYVLVDHDTLKKRLVPDDMRARLEAGAPDQRVDHAGYLAKT